MFEFGVSEGYCNSNVPKQCGKIGTPKEIKISKIKKSYDVINFEEFSKLLLISKDNEKYNTFFDLAFSKGPRIGEIRAFRVKDYSQESHKLFVNHTMNKKNILKEPKTAASKAPIDLDEGLVEKTENLINELKKKDDFNENWYIFNGPTPISENALREATNKYLKLAGIKHIRVHDFRHSCATWLYSIGTPITVISKILRHASIKETMKTYTPLFEEEYIECLENINSYKRNGIKQDQKQDQNI